MVGANPTPYYEHVPYGPGGQTSVYVAGGTPNAVRDEYLRVRNEFEIERNSFIKFIPEEGDTGNCDLVIGGGSAFVEGDPRRTVFGSKCFFTNIDTRTGQWAGFARSWLDPRAIAICPDGWRISGSGPNRSELPPVCYMPTSSKNNGPCPTCKPTAGNPIAVGSGNKYERSVDYLGQGIKPLSVVRHYNSLSSSSSSRLGAGWRLDFDRQVTLHKTLSGQQLPSVSVERGDGHIYYFRLQGGVWVGDADINDRLFEETDALGVRNGWRFYSASADQSEHYTPEGRLLEIRDRNGNRTIFLYSTTETAASIAPGAGYLIEVQDAQGRSMLLSYQVSGKLDSIMTPDGYVISYDYDSQGRLEFVTLPGGVQRRYHYRGDGTSNDPEAINNPYPFKPSALTGITDENNARYATFKYSAATGAAIETTYVGGVNNYKVGADNSVTDPLGTVRTYTLVHVAGVPTPYYLYQPCGTPDCTGTVRSNSVFDANRNLVSYTDFKNVTRTHTYDTARNLELTQTRANGRPEQQKTTKEWHPAERVMKRIAEPKRRTTYKYHLESGVSCAPSIAAPTLVCEKKLEATTDESGMLGFGATLDAAVSARSWSWTYNAQGQVLTATDPRGNVTTYTYHAATTAFVTQGDLASITNAAGHVSQFTEYDGAGRLKKMRDANGLFIWLTYTPRGWLSTRTVLNSSRTIRETTTYEYDAVGQIKKLIQPDGSFIEYFYDDAHRLERILDSMGNSITYTLDDMGNREGEAVKDPAQTLARSLTREYDALNRLKFDKGGSTPQPITGYSYDDQGNLKTVTPAGTGTITNDYDALNRLFKVTEPQVGTLGTTYTYDGQDNIKSVKDPKGNTTIYTYNGLGDRISQQSPDTGTTIYTHDLAGNVETAADSRGVVATYTNDVLNRVTRVVYSKVGSPSETHIWTYDTCANGIGRLCEVSDPSGTITYTYNPGGYVTSKTQTVNVVGSTPSRSFVASYNYNREGKLTSTSFPSGSQVLYGYNGNGQVDSMSVGGQTLLNNAGYEPFGPVAGWTWGNGSKSFFDYDLDGRTVQTEVQKPDQTAILKNEIRWDAASRVWLLGDLMSGGGKLAFTYDSVSRLMEVKNHVDCPPPSSGMQCGYFGPPNVTWVYDLNGNRTTETRPAGPTTFTTTYTIAPDSNRLNQIATSISGPHGPAIYSYDAAGNPTGITGSTYTYNLANRLTQVNGGAVAEYRVNALGQRVLKVTASGAVYFVYDEQGRLIGEYSPGSGTPERIQEHVWFNDRPVAVLKTVVPPEGGDFNGDGKADILWRNAVSGEVYLQQLSGLTVSGGGHVHIEGNPDWRVVAHADFNGDGKQDILWWNNSTGQVYMMLMNGVSKLSEGFVHQEPITTWRIVGAGDLNGDGKADILWHNNATGQTWGMLMNGLSIIGQGTFYDQPDLAWKIVATGDLNGDQKDDIIWRNTSTGHVWALLMSGLTVSAQGLIYTQPNQDWKLRWTGDFDGDGKSDLLWNNHATGEAWVQLMNGLSIAQEGSIYTVPDLQWKIVQAGDINGDGRADVIWHHGGTGHVYGLLMNGLWLYGEGVIHHEPNLAWRIVPVSDETGQGKATGDSAAPKAAVGQKPSSPKTASSRLSMAKSLAVTAVYYVHADHLGTPRAITRPSDNQVVWKWDNIEPFGNSQPNENPSGLGNFTYNLRFGGVTYYDQETGTLQNTHRDLDTGTGRYRQSDPIGLEGGINTYSYVLNNPLKYLDPDGKRPVPAGESDVPYRWEPQPGDRYPDRIDGQCLIRCLILKTVVGFGVGEGVNEIGNGMRNKNLASGSRKTRLMIGKGGAVAQWGRNVMGKTGGGALVGLGLSMEVCEELCEKKECEPDWVKVYKNQPLQFPTRR